MCRYFIFSDHPRREDDPLTRWKVVREKFSRAVSKRAEFPALKKKGAWEFEREQPAAGLIKIILIRPVVDRPTGFALPIDASLITDPLRPTIMRERSCAGGNYGALSFASICGPCDTFVRDFSVPDTVKGTTLFLWNLEIVRFWES